MSGSWESTKKWHHISSQRDMKIGATSLQTALKQQSPTRAKQQHELKMEKGLPEVPGKSPKSHPSRPRRSQETPGIPKGPPRHPTAPKRTSKEPKQSPKGPPNDPQKTPMDAIGIHKGLQKAPKKVFKRHPKGTQTQDRKSMQPSSRK